VDAQGSERIISDGGVVSFASRSKEWPSRRLPNRRGVEREENEKTRKKSVL
jgi:hypothetical protein